jgi:hypothetical protein
MRWLLLLTMTLTGCGPKSLPLLPGDSDSDGDADTDSDADADTDTDADTDSCLEIIDGNWGFNGDNFQGQATAQLIWDGSCTFTLQTWAPQGDFPNGGSVIGDQVTLTGAENVWSTCVGTFEEAEERVQGNCSLNDSPWGMQRM